MALIRHKLTSSLEVLCINRAEAEHYYRDIFRDACYFRHGIDLAECKCVFDVGANIGLFSLHILQCFEKAIVYAFEPAPLVFEALQQNVAAWHPRMHAFNVGIADCAKMLTLTYYPENTGMSSFLADIEEDKATLRTIIRNQIEGTAELGPMLECVDSIVNRRSRSEKYRCRVHSLSWFIDEWDVKEIDLLKIDVQRSEMHVLAGIRNEHWNRIRQIVIEVHDIDGRLKQVASLLQKHNFHVAIDQGEFYVGTPLFNVFAIR